MDDRGGRRQAPVVMVNRGWEWGIAIVLHAFFFFLMLEYHRWRGRDYIESLPAFLFVANKAMGIASLMSLSCAIAAGPLERLLGLSPRVVRMRRPVGVTGALGVIPHVIVSLFFLPKKFDWSYYVGRWGSAVLGLAALLGFIWLAAISWPWALDKFGPGRWRSWQRWGPWLLLVVFFHAVVLTGKLANWPDWFSKIGRPGNPPVPPGSVVIGLCTALALGLRAADWIAGGLRKKA